MILMNIEKTFSSFCDDIRLASIETYEASIKAIIKKLNDVYYELDSDEEHGLLVGSIGRQTAIKGVSDVDLIFEMPQDVFDKYDEYSDGSNGQSKLLQEVKSYLLERYPKTDISGDGQVVVIEFTSYTIELLPAFKQSDDSYLYPDTHDGGSWKKTDPKPEQVASLNANEKSNGNFTSICNTLRCWKDYAGFKFGGLLIDTLVHNFFNRYSDLNIASFGDYIDILTKVFDYLLSHSSSAPYLHALGSYQVLEFESEPNFLTFSEKALDKIQNAKNDEEIEEAFIEILGSKFKRNIKDGLLADKERMLESEYGIANKEEFIDNLFPVHILYSLKINCKIHQDGFRVGTLLDFILKRLILKANKRLEFYIEETNTPKPYRIFWKVKNRGLQAYRLNQLRGEITETQLGTKIEYTKFTGDHYVECYLVKNGICVARDRILVPIRTD